MSTILKSLKRLENDKEKQFVQGQVSFSNFDTRHTMNQAVRFALLKSRLMKWAIAVFVFFLGITVLYAYYRPENKPRVQQTATPAARPTGAVKQPHQRVAQVPGAANLPQHSDTVDHTQLPKPSAKPRIKPPPMRSDIAKPAVAPNRIATYPEPGPNPKVNLPEINLPKVRRPQTERRPRPDLARAPGAVAARRKPSVAPAVLPRDDERPSSGDPATASSNTDDSSDGQFDSSVYLNAERLTDGRLKVQAIVWAPDNKARMAVVNDRIVREGANIDGFLIVGIGEDALYVREDGMRLMKVPFGQP